jgi:hypothetical protein
MMRGCTSSCRGELLVTFVYSLCLGVNKARHKASGEGRLTFKHSLGGVFGSLNLRGWTCNQ